jgi:oligopeptidase B
MDDLVRIPLPPTAARRPVTVSRHGDTMTDDYAWLRDPEWLAVTRDPSRLSPDIRAYLEAENAYAAAMMADTAELQDRLVAEMRGRIAEVDASVPEPDGPFAYYRRYEEGGEHPLICRRSPDGAEQVLLDGPREAADKPYWRLAGFRQSPDHAYAAVAVDLDGSEFCCIGFRDLATGALLPDVLTGAQGDVVWANDGRTLFYTVLDEQHRPNRVYRHRLGEDPATDALVYEEGDPGFYLHVDRTESRRYLLIRARAHDTTSEVRLIDADAPDRAPVVFTPREAGHDYDVVHVPGRFFIRTNADGAKDYKIMEAAEADFDRGHWRVFEDHVPGRYIRRIEAFANHLVRLERADARPAIVVHRLADGRETTLAFDEEVYDLGLDRGYEFATPTLRVTYSSMTTPERVIDVDMDTDARTLRKEQRIPSGHDPADYVTRRLWATARDGARIPVSVLHRAGLALDGRAPLLLYGYGSYGFAMPAAFAANRLSLVDRGFVYAVAHVRGGSDLGYRWYEDGKLAAKENTFRDFIAAAEHLIAEGYTSAGRIVAQGRSAGGMLMGVVANRRPDLFAGILAEVPFVDVLNTMCDASLPLTPPEWAEWGNPIDDAAAYRRMRGYCPYSNVARQAYPNILAIAGLTDPRVTYWEPAKWIAKLRALKVNGSLALLHTVMEAGHGGAPGRFARLDEVALSYAFALKVVGITEP